jgi:ketopantoate reductase
MKAYLSSTLIDFERGLPLELNALFRLPLGRAQAAGVETPRLASLSDLLAELDYRRKDSGSDAA